MKKLISLVILTIVLSFGHITLWQPLSKITTEETPKNNWYQGSEQPWWNEYTAPQPQQDIVVPFSPDFSNSLEAQKLKKQKEEAEKNAKKCNWIKLNTDFPIIWNCITISEWQANPTNVFPWMMRALTRIIMSIILVVCFIMIIIAWIMRAWAWEDSSQKTKAKDIIKKVAIAVLLLWFSWAILRLINPNFFG